MPGIYALSRAGISEREREGILRGIVNSPYFGSSALGPQFVRTDGFSVVFQRSAYDAVVSMFPYLEPVLRVAVFDTCNAFYVNPLVLYRASQVGAHIDCRAINGGAIRIIPNLVSIYYAQIPEDMAGGKLVLNAGTENEVRIAPSTGDLVHFIGTNVHRVESIETASAPRVCVVCEQYNLDSDGLSNFPFCSVLTANSDVSRVDARELMEGGENP